MSQAMDALIAFEKAQGQRVADESIQTVLTAAKAETDAKFNNGATLTTGPTFLPKPVKDLLDQMTAERDKAAADLEAQSAVVRGDYLDEQAKYNVARNLLGAALNVGAGSIL